MAVTGLLQNNSICSENSQCISNYCSNFQITVLGAFPQAGGERRCQPTTAETTEMLRQNAVVQLEAQGAAALIYTGIGAIPTIAEAALPVYTTVQAALQTAPGWVPTALRTGGVILGNLGVIQGARRCQEDPSSLECAGLVVSAQLGLLDDLARETGALAEQAGQTIGRYGTQYLDDAQRAYAFNQQYVNATRLGQTAPTDITPPTLQQQANLASTVQEAAESIPDTVILETGEIITLGEQIGSSGKQGSVFLGTRCTGQTCVIKLFNPAPGFEPVSPVQMEIMSQYASAEQISQTGLSLPEYYGAVINSQGQITGYAMQYVQGQTALEIYAAQGGLTFQQANEIFDAAYGFQQTTGIPHGDLANDWYQGGVNLNNIVINQEGRAILIDPSGTALDPGETLTLQGFMEQELENLRIWLQNHIVR